MSETSIQKCPQCGATLTNDAPGGLCPKCLMALNFATDTVFPGDSSQRHPPLPMEQIALHFPQLEILECLGRGGMGVVYKARQKTLNRFAALKVLAPERVLDANFAERFAREARALAALNHPNIVTIYDFGQAGGFYYLLMEFVDGANLRQLLRARKLTPEEALVIVPPLCDALQFAHDRGIVHRDIKPENLLLDKEGRVKVADFGIVKMLGATNDPSEPAGIVAPETVTHSAVGTPGYSAPEQMNDPQKVDSRADIYSLGVVFYEMLTGERPGQRLEPPSKKVSIDVRLDAVVLRALEEKPELRFQQASTMKTQVETIAADAGKAKKPTAPSKRSRIQSIGLMIADTILAVFMVVGGWAANSMGIFFNAIFMFVFVMAFIRIFLVIWHLCRGTLAYNLWRKPLAVEVRKYWWQALNCWIFWLLAAFILKLCVMPVQFPPAEYAQLHHAWLGGIGLLLLLALLPGQRVNVGTNIAFAIGSIFMGAQVARIDWPQSLSNAVVLAAPFRGEWVVFNGGRSKVLNQNYDYINQRDALDIERVVNGQERISKGNQLKSYPSWDQPLYAPADGAVVATVNDVDDNPIGQSDEENSAGNHLVINIGNDRFLEMDYLQKGSVLVQPGDTVHIGQPIAKCGNSGLVGRPILHLQAQNNPDRFAAGTTTYPIAFRDVTCLRSGHPRTDSPFFVRRNDLIISQPAADKTSR